ncbi:hypothetical protein M378DRAFT_161688 [Amanita muscaria Koide BX008]|uniref:Uncharacterized protein n=1 Tax=Amanita muscaria (strain Koide BX008) TaxID=946122 RepID=A0A0C2SQY8_AMAMK|nr:hypothetical protein M378DRAFT_161688 [Amanita muscaria Koide BX008]
MYVDVFGVCIVFAEDLDSTLEDKKLDQNNLDNERTRKKIHSNSGSFTGKGILRLEVV